MGRKKKQEDTIETKVRALDETFVDEMIGAQADKLKDKVVSLAKYEEEILEAKKADTDLSRILEEKSTAEATYKEALSGIKLKRKYVLALLKEKGN